MDIWMFEVLWNGNIKRLHICNGIPKSGIQHDDKMVWGLVSAENKEVAIDKITDYMVKNGDSVFDSKEVPF